MRSSRAHMRSGTSGHRVRDRTAWMRNPFGGGRRRLATGMLRRIGGRLSARRLALLGLR
jgi:hypothetical protein